MSLIIISLSGSSPRSIQEKSGGDFSRVILCLPAGKAGIFRPPGCQDLIFLRADFTDFYPGPVPSPDWPLLSGGSPDRWPKPALILSRFLVSIGPERDQD